MTLVTCLDFGVSPACQLIATGAEELGGHGRVRRKRFPCVEVIFSTVAICVLAFRKRRGPESWKSPWTYRFRSGTNTRACIDGSGANS